MLEDTIARELAEMVKEHVRKEIDNRSRR